MARVDMGCPLEQKGAYMRNNGKKGIFILGSIGLVAGITFGITKAKKNEECAVLARVNTIRYAENISSSAEGEGNSSDASSSTASDNAVNNVIDYGKDENNNGIPDKIEELIKSSNTDKIMGTTITAAMNACLNIITFIYGLYRWKQLTKNVNDTSNDATKNVLKWSNITNDITSKITAQQANIETLQAQIDKATKSEEAQTKAIEEMKKSNEDLIKSNQELSKGYSSVSTRLDTILQNQALTASTSADAIKSGASAQIKKNAEGAINYGKVKDQSEGN